MGLERRERRKVDDEQGHRRRRHRCECLRADPPGTLAASGTGLKPAMDLLDMLTTAAGGARSWRWPWLGQCDLSASFWCRSVNPLRGEPPTGKPDAGNPPVRFGGRGDGQPLLPIPIYGKFVARIRVTKVP